MILMLAISPWHGTVAETMLLQVRFLSGSFDLRGISSGKEVHYARGTMPGGAGKSWSISTVQNSISSAVTPTEVVVWLLVP